MCSFSSLFPSHSQVSALEGNYWLNHPDFFFFFFSFLGFTCSTWKSQARGRIGAAASGLPHLHRNAGALTHWAGPGIEPATSWILVGFVNPLSCNGSSWVTGIDFGYPSSWQDQDGSGVEELYNINSHSHIYLLSDYNGVTSWFKCSSSC